MNKTSKMKLTRALIAPHAARLIRPDMVDDLSTFLSDRIEIDDEGNVSADPAAVVGEWVKAHPIVGIEAPKTEAPKAAVPAAAPAREISASGRDALRNAVVQALTAQAHPPKTDGGL